MRVSFRLWKKHPLWRVLEMLDARSWAYLQMTLSKTRGVTSSASRVLPCKDVSCGALCGLPIVRR